MSGPFGKEVDRLLVSAGMSATEVSSAERTRSPDVYKEDVKLFGLLYGKEKLFEFVPKRKLTTVDVRHNFDVKTPFKLGSHLRRLAEDRDYWEKLRRDAERRYNLHQDNA